MKTWRQSPIFASDDSDKRRRRPRSGWAALIVMAVLATWGYLFGPYNKQEREGKLHLALLRKEFEKITLPPGTSAIEDLTGHSRGAGALIQRSYASTLPVESVFASYREQLSSNGWTYSGRFQAGGDTIETYCKGESGADVEVRPKGDSFVYFFSMAWSQVTVKECSAKKQEG